MKERKERNETNFREAVSKDGSFSPHINKKTSERLTRYCKVMNQNRTRFVEACINEQLDRIERQAYEPLTKDELIDIILKR